MKAENLQAAFVVWQESNWIPSEDANLSHRDNTLQKIIEKEEYLSLSWEAKFLLKLVLDTPDELVENLREGFWRISPKKLRGFAGRINIDYKKVREEIRGYIRTKYDR